MFRPLTRKKQALSAEECIALLTSETRGVLAVNGDGAYPYAMPMNHYYCPDDACLYFHCGKIGHRIDALRRSDKVSFCVCEQGTREADDWALTVRSVIVFGRIEIVNDLDKIVDITAALSQKFTHDEAYIRKEIAHFAKDTLLLKLIPEHIGGKRVKEA